MGLSLFGSFRSLGQWVFVSFRVICFIFGSLGRENNKTKFFDCVQDKTRLCCGVLCPLLLSCFVLFRRLCLSRVVLLPCVVTYMKVAKPCVCRASLPPLLNPKPNPKPKPNPSPNPKS
jgi:hypothetical protein